MAFRTFRQQGNTVGSLDPAGTATRQEYDVLGRVKRITVGVGASAVVTNIEHDSVGNVTHVDDPDRGIHAYQYDGLGFPHVAIRNGEETRYYWDSLGRLSLQTSVDGTEAYAWDTDGTNDPSFAGRLVSSVRVAAEGTSSYRFRYDGPDGLVSSETVLIADQTLVTSYSYDPGAVLGLVRWPNGVGARYGPSGRTTEVRDADAAPNAPALWKATTWNQFGGVTDRNYAPGFGLHTDMDPRTAAVTGQRTTVLPNGLNYTYGYDPKGWLRTRSGAGYSESFTPDATGRIDVYERSQAGNVVLGIDHGYDAIGNLDSIEAVGTQASLNVGTLTYDPANKPRAVRAVHSRFKTRFRANNATRHNIASANPTPRGPSGGCSRGDPL